MRKTFEWMIRLHRFLVNQLVYPILLSTILALALFAGRVYLSRSLSHSNLVWNLFLAWVPFVCSFLAATVYSATPRSWWLLLLPGALWLIFFPNAPYIITDFQHLADRPRIPFWYDIIMFATFAWTGCFLAVASLRVMQTLVKNYVGWFASWFFAAVALALGGLGIYLGRFSRWNSWDLFLRPKEILYDIVSHLIDPMSNLRFFGFTFAFTAFLLVCYLMFISVRHVGDSEHQ